MDNSQYEKSYRTAREILILRGKNIGKTILRDGVRYCPFEEMLLSDREIFVEAWSEEIAEEITQEHSRTEPTFPSPDSVSLKCVECEQLHLTYSHWRQSYMQILQLKSEGLVGLLVSDDLVEAVRLKREVSSQALRSHEDGHRKGNRLTAAAG